MSETKKSYAFFTRTFDHFELSRNAMKIFDVVVVVIIIVIDDDDDDGIAVTLADI